MRRRDRAFLHQIRLKTADDVGPLLAAVADRDERGSITLVGISPTHRFVGVVHKADEEGREEDLVHAGASVAGGEVARLVVVTNRTGQLVPRRDDDPERWIAMHDDAAGFDVVLLDWLVVFGHKAFSVGERSSLKPPWGETRGAIDVARWSRRNASGF